MARQLRLVFMGTPDFAVPSLQRLHESGYVIAGVVTAPDKPAGRGQKLKESAVKQYARSQGFPILQPNNLKDPGFQHALAALEPDLQVVVAFRKLPQAVWQLPPYGTFNLHASLLPDYRGAAPIHWALINGERQTGVTTFFMNNRIDAGTLIQQERVPIAEDETAGSLHDKLMEQGADLVKQTVDAIADGTAVPQPQPEVSAPKQAPKIDKETCQINWAWPLRDIYNFIRGLSPYPGAYTAFQGQQLKIFGAEPQYEENHYSAGRILTNRRNQLSVAVLGGYLHLKQMQLAGRQRMSVEEFLNGFTVPEGYSFLADAPTQ